MDWLLNYLLLRLSLASFDSLTSSLILIPYYFTQVSKEGDDFPVDIDVARMSELVKGMLEG